MASTVSIAIRLQGAQRFAADSAKAALSLAGIGSAADAAALAARAMGGAFDRAASISGRAFGALAGQAKFVAFGVGAVAAAGVKMGLSFNAQVESARLRFRLFTDDVDGLTKSVQAIDVKSQFNFGDLSDAAALFGNNGIQDIPKTLQAAANAAAASGKGTEGFKSIAIALSQIAAKGKLSQEEINQLNEAGAPGAQKIIADHFHLTAKELGNLGGQGLDAKEAIKALTDEWTSGKMADAAEAQTKTLGGQWALLTGNLQKLSGAATAGLAGGLEHNVIPAANRAVDAITQIFGQKGLTNEQKLIRARQVIRRELGPVWNDIKQDLDKAHIPEKLGDAVAAATPKILDAMATIAPKAAKAFVDGWMNSGPEAKVITALFLANKLRKSGLGDLISRARGGSGPGGSTGGWFTPAGRGSSAGVPVYVQVVKGGGGLAGTAKTAAKTVAPAVAAFGGAAEIGALASGVGVAGLIGYVAAKNAHNNYDSRAGGNSVAKQAAGTSPAPGFGGGPPGALNIKNTLMIDGKAFAGATAQYTQIEQGRLIATKAASR